MATSYNSNYGETMPFSDACVQINCGASVQQAWTVPGTPQQLFQAYFEYTQNSNVFVSKNAVPVVPSIGTIGQQQYSEFRPKKRYVRGGDILHFITPDTNAYVGVSLRQLQG